MKGNYNLSIILLSISIALAGYFVSETLTKSNQNNRSVRLKGLAVREMPADVAVWPMEIKLSGNELSVLHAKVQDQKKKVKAFFLSMGFDENEINVGATNVVDRTMNAYNNDFKGDRYLAVANLTIRTKDIALIQEAHANSVDLTAEGILLSSQNQWSPIQYSFSGLNDIKPEMIEMATVNAKEAADRFAKNSDSHIGKIKTASQGLFTISDLDLNTPETKVVRVVSTIEFYLED